jgi:hypothetical protein
MSQFCTKTLQALSSKSKKIRKFHTPRATFQAVIYQKAILTTPARRE